MSKREEVFQQKFGSDLESWRDDLQLTPTKQPKPLLTNAVHALRSAPEWNGVLGYDEFALCAVLLTPPPWLKQLDNDWVVRRWDDCDDTLCCDWLQREGIAISISVTASAAVTVAKDATFHPVRDYLNGLAWDGQARVARFAATYLGAEDTAYHANVSIGMFIAAVARIMQPGCKHDHMPILEGAQDKGKSTAIDLLFRPWFSDDLAELGTKDSQMQICGVWGVEVAELASMTRGEIERVKAFVTRRVDRFRPSYGRHVIEVPRQAVFIGSTNADLYLKDETGGRRFWPIRCGRIDLKAIARDRDQLWAEAVKDYRAGKPWWLQTDKDTQQARDEQSERYVEDPWHDSVARYLEGREDTAVTDILENHLSIEKAKWTQNEQNRVARILKVLQWERYRAPRPERQWRYRHAGPG